MDRSRIWPMECVNIALILQTLLGWGIWRGEVRDYVPSVLFYLGMALYMAALGCFVCSLYLHLWLKRTPRTWQEFLVALFWLFTGVPLMLGHVLSAAQFPMTTLEATFGIDLVILAIAIWVIVTGSDLPEPVS